MSELQLFYARIYDVMGQTEKAIKLLKDKESEIVDHLTYNETLHSLYIKSGNKEKALDHLDNLLELNSANNNYYLQILEDNGIPIHSKEKLSQE